MTKRSGGARRQPRGAYEEARQQAPALANAGLGQPTASEPARVLIAEDEPAIAEVLALVIAQAGYIPFVATDGQTALALARTSRPALVITDLKMPHLDGAGLIVALRVEAAAEGRSAPPIILMSAFRQMLGEAMGADATLAKPFHLTDVLQLLEHFLRGYET
jgi:DNA-binding response OmpR family regulator